MPDIIQPTPDRILGLIDGQLIDLSPGFGADEDLFAAGLDSMAIMQLMLLIEETFGTPIPMGDVTRENFHSAAAIARLIAEKQAVAGDS